MADNQSKDINSSYNEMLEAGGSDAPRDKVIIRTSIIGILANVFLAGFKAAVGLISNSIAVILDAVNNLSDAASSVITIIGTKLAAREPDKKHPFGYGRIEYLSALVISLIVLYAGVTSFTESVKKIIKPAKPDYSAAALIIIGAAVLVKIILGRYVKSVGEKVDSDALVNSGEDAVLDSVISASTLAAAAVYLIWHISLEAYLGAVISIVIIKSGIGMITETLSRVLGERADPKTAAEIKKTVCSYDEVKGVYDLVLNDYGPDRMTGSVHIEVPDTLNADDIDRLTRVITVDVYQKTGIILTAVGVYSVNTRDEEAVRLRKLIRDEVLSHEHIMQMHGFYLDKENSSVRFDLMVSFDAKDRRAVFGEAVEAVKKLCPQYRIDAALDTDFSESITEE